MGLFRKLTSRMNGGVAVHIQAPSAVASNQVIPVALTITSDSSQTITGVKAELKAEARQQGVTFGSGQGVGVQDSRSMSQTVAQAENRDTLTIGPGETKTVNMELYLNSGAVAGPIAQLGNVGGAVGGVLQAVVSVAQNFDHINYIYTVHASVYVEGHNLHPSDSQSIQILPPNAPAQTPQVENLQPQSQTPPVQPAMPTPVVAPPTQPLPPTDPTNPTP